jgi:hypothetical protein
MALQSTGPISMQDVNTELRPITTSATAQICLNQTAIRSLLGRPTDISSISLNDAYGKDIRGQPWCGGRVIAKALGTPNAVWIVAPASTQISDTFANINTAVTNAQTTTGVTGWYIPGGNTGGELNTIGYACRSFWDSYNATTYWSSTQNDTFSAYAQDFNTGTVCAGITFCIPCIPCISCIPCIAPIGGRPSQNGRPGSIGRPQTTGRPSSAGRPGSPGRPSGFKIPCIPCTPCITPIPCIPTIPCIAPIPCIPCITCIAPVPGRPAQDGRTDQTGSCGGNKTSSYCVRAFKCVTF